MFITTDYLVINYGVDEEIARFFVDREPPANNLYWHEKLLYLRPGAGYIFIPLIIDLLFKSGIPKHELLSTEFINTMEQIGHISALEEVKKIDAATAVQYCAELVKKNNKDSVWYNDVSDYLAAKHNYISSLTSPFKALHRGDVFLFSLCALHFPETIREKVVEQWFALITTLLLQDDINDMHNDSINGDENALLEYGFTREAIAMCDELMDKNVEILSRHNRSMANTLGRKYKELIAKPLEILNQK